MLDNEKKPSGSSEKESALNAETHIVKVLETDYVTHDVKRFVVEKPKGYKFIPGQSVNLAVNLPEWKDKFRPFSFTNLPHDKYLEFMIKIYRERKGVTNLLDEINKDEELILGKAFGVIQYKGEGVFIAAGSGITPFLSILRDLNASGKMGRNLLIYSNKKNYDVIRGEELFKMLGNNFIQVFTRETIGFIDQRIDMDFLIETIGNFNQPFYLCGPASFVKDISSFLVKLGANAESILFEE
jgi:ferredoxin-NADP reductase